MSSSVQASDVFGFDKSFPFTRSRVRHNLLCSRYVVTPNIIGCFVSKLFKELRGQKRLYLFSNWIDCTYKARISRWQVVSLCWYPQYM